MKTNDERWWCNVWATTHQELQQPIIGSLSRWTPHGPGWIGCCAVLSVLRCCRRRPVVIVDPDAPIPFSHFFFSSCLRLSPLSAFSTGSHAAVFRAPQYNYDNHQPVVSPYCKNPPPFHPTSTSQAESILLQCTIFLIFFSPSFVFFSLKNEKELGCRE